MAVSPAVMNECLQSNQSNSFNSRKERLIDLRTEWQGFIHFSEMNNILTVRSETQPATPIHSTNQFTEIKWNWWEWKELRQVKRGMNSINHFKRIDFISFIIITVITWLLFISISLCYKVWAKKKSMIIEFELRVIIFCYCFVFTSMSGMKVQQLNWM